MSLQAGFASSDLAPPVGLAMAGYAARSGVADGVLDALQCRVAVFRGGDAAVALVLLDLLYVGAAWASAVRERIAAALATEKAAVLVAATHTHSGPAICGPEKRGAELQAYEARVADVVLETAKRAAAALGPCALSFGVARALGVGASRREAPAAVDDRVRVAVARRADGSCAGVVATFGCHPTILPPSNLLYSRDLFGAAVDVAQAESGAPVLLFNGAAADVSTRFTRREATGAEVRRLGAILGAALMSAVRGADRVAGDVVGAELRSLAVEVNLLPDEAEASARMVGAMAAAEKLRARGVAPAELRLAVSRLEGAMAQVFLARQGGWPAIFGGVPERAEVQQLRLGGVRLVAAPGEVFSFIGERICAGGARLLVGYANDYLGYLVPPECAGDGEYEATMAMLRSDSAAALGDALERLAHA